MGRGQGGGRAIPVVCMPAADVTPLSAGPFMARVREAFAGVRSATPADDEAQQDLTCCAYGRSCAIFRDDAAAALFNTGQHLQSWLGSGNVTVDRYDVRLLLHDAGQLGTTGKHTASASETAEEEEIEIERYRDLYPVQTPAASPEPEAESIFTETSGMGGHNNRGPQLLCCTI